MAKDFEHQEDNAVSGDFETEFHYPVGKLEEETVRDPHGGWAPEDFDANEFDYEFDAVSYTHL